MPRVRRRSRSAVAGGLDLRPRVSPGSCPLGGEKGEAMTDDDVGRGAILSVVPTSWRLFVKVDPSDSQSSGVSGEMRLAPRQSVKLSTQEEFDSLHGVFEFLVGGETKPGDDKPIGSLRYYEELSGPYASEKACYHLGVRMPQRKFDILLAAVSQGRLPSAFTIHVVGMAEDPDSFGTRESKLWDNKNRPELPITSIRVAVPLIGGEPNDRVDDTIVEDSLPPTRAQVNALSEALQELAGKSKKAVLYFFIIVCLLFVLVWLRL